MVGPKGGAQKSAFERVGPKPTKNRARWVGPRRVAPRRVGGPKFRPFFFPSPAPFLVFLSLSGCLLVEFWWCFEAPGTQMCTFGVLGLSCEAPAAPKPIWHQTLWFHQSDVGPRIDLTANKAHFLMKSLECFMTCLMSAVTCCNCSCCS